MTTTAASVTKPDPAPVVTAEMTLRERLDEYLVMRRALGYQLDTLEMLAGGFCDWLTGQGKTTFTTADAVTWARLPAEANPVWWGMRLGAVRTFAAYLHATGVDVEVPPRGILPARSTRAVPFIYSQADLDALLGSCPRVFTHGFAADTMRTLIGLLAVTGIRIGEALRLTPDDLHTDLTSGVGVLLIRRGKNGAARLVPVHPTTTEALVAYRDLPARARMRPDPDGPLFVSSRGTGYHRSTIEAYFARMVSAAGLTARGRARPRVHDLRHAFATAHMTAAYQTGADPQRTLTLLATWLGHTSAAHTYWYLTATPDLMALAADRLEPPPRP
jgi:integrase